MGRRVRAAERDVALATRHHSITHRYLLLREPRLFGGGGDGRVFADVGVGDAATTTLELASALGRRDGAPRVVATWAVTFTLPSKYILQRACSLLSRSARPRLWVPQVATEADAARAGKARRACDGVADVRQTDGGFALPLRPGERCVGARAMNVFRSSYTEPAAAAAVAELAASLDEGAPLIEGSCSRTGDAGVAHVLRKRGDGVSREALLLAVDPARARGTAPLALRPYLPRDIRWKFRAGSPVYAFWTRWTAAWKAARLVSAPEDVFRASGEAMRGDGVEVLGPGLLLWRPDGGVPVS